jgi:hypothetical protein
VNLVASRSLPRSLSVFRVSSRAVGVSALSTRLLRLPGVFSWTLWLFGTAAVAAVAAVVNKKSRTEMFGYFQPHFLFNMAPPKTEVGPQFWKSK